MKKNMKKNFCMLLTFVTALTFFPTSYAMVIDNSVTDSYVSVSEDFSMDTEMATPHQFPSSCTDKNQLTTTQLSDSDFYAVAPTQIYANSKYTSTASAAQVTANGLKITDTWGQTEESQYTYGGKGKVLYTWNPTALSLLSNDYKVTFATNGGNSLSSSGFRFHVSADQLSYYMLAWGHSNKPAWRLYKVTEGVQTLVASSPLLPSTSITNYVKHMNATIIRTSDKIILDLAYGYDGIEYYETYTYQDNNPFTLSAKNASMGFVHYYAESCTISSMQVDDYVPENTAAYIPPSGVLMIDTDSAIEGCETRVCDTTLSALSGEYAYQVLRNETPIGASLFVDNRNILCIEDNAIVPLRTGSASITAKTENVAITERARVIHSASSYNKDFTALKTLPSGLTSEQLTKGVPYALDENWTALVPSNAVYSRMPTLSINNGLVVTGNSGTNYTYPSSPQRPFLIFDAMPDIDDFEIRASINKSSVYTGVTIDFMRSQDGTSYYQLFLNSNKALDGFGTKTYLFQKVVDGAVVETSVLEGGTTCNTTNGEFTGDIDLLIKKKGDTISWSISGKINNYNNNNISTLTGSYTDTAPFPYAIKDSTIAFSCCSCDSSSRTLTIKNFFVGSEKESDPTVVSRIDGDLLKVYCDASEIAAATSPQMMLVPYTIHEDLTDNGTENTPAEPETTSAYTASLDLSSSTASDTIYQIETDSSYYPLSQDPVQIGETTLYLTPPASTLKTFGANAEKVLFGDGKLILQSGLGDTIGRYYARECKLLWKPAGYAQLSNTYTISMDAENSISNISSGLRFHVSEDGANYYMLRIKAPKYKSPAWELVKMNNGTETVLLSSTKVPVADTDNLGYTQRFQVSIQVDNSSLSHTSLTISFRGTSSTGTDLTENVVYNDMSPFSHAVTDNYPHLIWAGGSTNKAYLYSLSLEGIYDNSEEGTITPDVITETPNNSVVLQPLDTSCEDGFQTLSIPKNAGEFFKLFIWDFGQSLTPIIDPRKI